MKRLSSTSKTGKAAIALFVVVILLSLTWTTGRAAFASLLSAYASKSYELEAADAAVTLSGRSPDASYVRGTILEARKDLPGAAEAYRQATLNRPEDCIYWLSLARVRELNGQTEDALAAARQSVPLAPYYAQPHWQLGNILMRSGQTDEAFKELRLATRSDPRLLPGVIDLAWRVSSGDAEFVQTTVQPKTSAEYQTIGRYLRQLGELDAALFIYNAAAGGVPESERLENVAALVAAKKYKEAHGLWAPAHQQHPPNVMFDPGFEEESNLEEPGFGWRTAERVVGFQLSLDTANPKEGRSSLKIDYDGDSLPDAPVISQLVLVEANARYELKFSVRTEAIVTGGLPRVNMFDATNNTLLGQSAEFPQGTNGWQDYAFEFETGPSTSAVQLRLQRQLCTASSCPIFGHLWLDNVKLRKL